MVAAKSISTDIRNGFKKGQFLPLSDNAHPPFTGKSERRYLKWRICMLLILALGFSSCTISPHKAFSRMENLEGAWKSTGSIDLNFIWHRENDSSMRGRVFSLEGVDTLFLEDYQVLKSGDSLWLQLDNEHLKRLTLKDANLREILFENPSRTYPNRVIFEWESDSIVIFRKENIRGNRPIKFSMKRLPL